MKKLDELLARIPELQARARQRAERESQSPPQAAALVQLPLWPEPVRAVPNGFLRSALFGAIAKGRRRYINGEDLAAVDGVTVKQGRYSYIGSLISFAAKDEDTQEWVIELDPRLRPLFAADQFTQIEWAVRHELNGKPMAQWLHGFYASHAKPFPIKVETLHRLCGSEAKRMSDYKVDMRRNLDAVADASAAHGEGVQLRDSRRRPCARREAGQRATEAALGQEAGQAMNDIPTPSCWPKYRAKLRKSRGILTSTPCQSKSCWSGLWRKDGDPTRRRCTDPF